MTRIYIAIIGVALALLACTKRQAPPAIVDPVLVDSVAILAPIEPPKEFKTRKSVSRISPIYYEVNAYKLTEGQLIQVKRIAKKIKGAVTVKGYADTTGSKAYNQALSHRRALAVLEALVALGIDRDSLTAIGMGEASGPLSKARKTVITLNP